MTTLIIQGTAIRVSIIVARSISQHTDVTSWKWWRTDSQPTFYKLMVFTNVGGHHFFGTYDKAERDGWVQQVDACIGGSS